MCMTISEGVFRREFLDFRILILSQCYGPVVTHAFAFKLTKRRLAMLKVYTTSPFSRCRLKVHTVGLETTRCHSLRVRSSKWCLEQASSSPSFKRRTSRLSVGFISIILWFTEYLYSPERRDKALLFRTESKQRHTSYGISQCPE